MNEGAIILASASSSRRAMLTAAGVDFATLSSGIDEELITERMAAERTDPAKIAQALAEAKAVAVSTRRPDALVIGANQVLVCDGAMLGKAQDEGAARRTLIALKGRRHRLISAAVIAKRGKGIWRRTETVELLMRDFSVPFLDAYLAAEIPDVLGSVGCYRIEGRGAQLFDRVDGDQFCIRGLPLLPLLAALRQYGALLS